MINANNESKIQIKKRKNALFIYFLNQKNKVINITAVAKQLSIKIASLDLFMFKLLPKKIVIKHFDYRLFCDKIITIWRVVCFGENRLKIRKR